MRVFPIFRKCERTLSPTPLPVVLNDDKERLCSTFFVGTGTSTAHRPHRREQRAFERMKIEYLLMYYTSLFELRKLDVKKANPRERLRKPVSQMKGVLRK